MAHKKHTIKNNYLIHADTGSIIQELSVSNEENKYYAAVVMCGHCGKDYFLPILFPFWCKQDEINIVARQIARVKRDYKECILCSGEIDESTYRLIELINEGDGYLKPAFIGFDDRDVEDRKIILQRAVEEFMNNEEKTHDKMKMTDLSYVKTADMYPNDMVLQKTFAPRLTKSYTAEDKKYKTTRNIYSFPTKVKIEDFIDDYLTNSTYKYGISRGRLSLIGLYYKLYGPKNKLGIKYKEGKITYKDKNGTFVTQKVSDKMRMHLETEQIGIRYKEQKKDPYQEIVDTYGKENTSPSGLERFNRRLSKFAKKNPEPGDEE